ncbi:MAG: hypothetical protein R3B09_33025 [Nannocystaceae bacterium]
MTSLRDEVIADVKVAPAELVGVVASYAILPDTCIYIDGRPLTREKRTQLLQAIIAAGVDPQAPAEAPRAPASAPESQAPARVPTAIPTGEVVTWIEIQNRGLADLHRGYEEIRRAAAEVHEFLRRGLENDLAIQRELADECVRQRRLCGQSLADIDVFHRAVKTAELSEAFAERKMAHGYTLAANAPATSAASPAGMTWGDLLRAVAHLANGQ